MSLSVDKAKEALGGFVASDNSGQNQAFYTGGTASPVGSACPTPTIYLQAVSPTEFRIWRNTGPLGTDWTEITGGTNFSYKRVDSLVTIPTDQEMVVSCLEVTATGCLEVSDGACLTVLG